MRRCDQVSKRGFRWKKGGGGGGRGEAGGKKKTHTTTTETGKRRGRKVLPQKSAHKSSEKHRQPLTAVCGRRVRFFNAGV